MAIAIGDLPLELTITPKACEGEKALIRGTVTIKLPSILEKYEYLEQFGLKVNGEGKIDFASLDSMKMIKHLIAMSEKHYKSIDLVKGNDKIDSWDKFIHEPACESVAIEVGVGLVKGFTPSGN